VANQRYIKGRNFENYVADKLRKAGYYVIRSAGSKGVFDLIAIKNGVPYGIQCKYDGYINAHELNKLIETGRKYFICPALAYKDGNRVRIVLLHSRKDLLTGDSL